MEATATEQSQAAPPPRSERYEAEIPPALVEKFGYSSPMEAPRLLKITLNMGVGEAKQDSNMLDAASEQLATIAGQRPNVRRARKSIASFKVREGMPVGVSVTLRRARMWEFLDRLCSVAVPRIRDFRGLNPRSFDGRGNYSMGVREQLIFPEIDYDSIDQVRGLDVTITTTAKSETRRHSSCSLALGMPFAQESQPAAVDEQAEGRGRGGASQGRGARLRAEAEAGRPRAAEGGEPRGLRQARGARGGRGGRRGGRRRWKCRKPARGRDAEASEKKGPVMISSTERERSTQGEI